MEWTELLSSTVTLRSFPLKGRMLARARSCVYLHLALLRFCDFKSGWKIRAPYSASNLARTSPRSHPAIQLLESLLT